MNTVVYKKEDSHVALENVSHVAFRDGIATICFAMPEYPAPPHDPMIIPVSDLICITERI